MNKKLFILIGALLSTMVPAFAAADQPHDLTAGERALLPLFPAAPPGSKERLLNTFVGAAAPDWAAVRAAQPADLSHLLLQDGNIVWEEGFYQAWVKRYLPDHYTKWKRTSSDINILLSDRDKQGVRKTVLRAINPALMNHQFMLKERTDGARYLAIFSREFTDYLPRPSKTFLRLYINNVHGAPLFRLRADSLVVEEEGTDPKRGWTVAAQRVGSMADRVAKSKPVLPGRTYGPSQTGGSVPLMQTVMMPRIEGDPLTPRSRADIAGGDTPPEGGRPLAVAFDPALRWYTSHGFDNHIAPNMGNHHVRNKHGERLKSAGVTDAGGNRIDGPARIAKVRELLTQAEDDARTHPGLVKPFWYLRNRRELVESLAVPVYHRRDRHGRPAGRPGLFFPLTRVHNHARGHHYVIGTVLSADIMLEDAPINPAQEAREIRAMIHTPFESTDLNVDQPFTATQEAQALAEKNRIEDELTRLRAPEEARRAEAKAAKEKRREYAERMRLQQAARKVADLEAREARKDRDRDKANNPATWDAFKKKMLVLSRAVDDFAARMAALLEDSKTTFGSHLITEAQQVNTAAGRVKKDADDLVAITDKLASSIEMGGDHFMTIQGSRGEIADALTKIREAKSGMDRSLQQVRMNVNAGRAAAERAARVAAAQERSAAANARKKELKSAARAAARARKEEEDALLEAAMREVAAGAPTKGGDESRPARKVAGKSKKKKKNKK